MCAVVALGALSVCTWESFLRAGDSECLWKWNWSLTPRHCVADLEWLVFSMRVLLHLRAILHLTRVSWFLQPASCLTKMNNLNKSHVYKIRQKWGTRFIFRNIFVDRHTTMQYLRHWTAPVTISIILQIHNENSVVHNLQQWLGHRKFLELLSAGRHAVEIKKPL